MAETQRVGRSLSLSKGAEREARRRSMFKRPREGESLVMFKQQKGKQHGWCVEKEESGQQWWGSVAHGKILRGNIRKAH